MNTTQYNAKTGLEVDTTASFLVSTNHQRHLYFANSSFSDAKMGNRLSWGWRSILAGRALLHKGMRWQIGLGELRSISAAICRIPIHYFEALDRKIWHFTDAGLYSVKSGYHLAKQLTVDSRPSTNNTTPAIREKFWRQIWKPPIPPKIQTFIWRTCHNTLAVGRNLLKRKIPIDGACPLCNYEDETTFIFFWNARALGAFGLTLNCPCILLGILLKHFKNGGGNGLFHPEFKNENFTLGVRLSITLWGIWNMRNDVVFKGIKPDPISTIHRVEGLITEVRAAPFSDLSLLLDSSNRRSDKSMPWHSQEKEWIKVNVDSSALLSGLAVGVGIVACDHNRNILLHHSKPLLGGSSRIAEAEAQALNESIKLSEQMHFGPYQERVGVPSRRPPPLPRLATTIRDLVRLMKLARTQPKLVPSFVAVFGNSVDEIGNQNLRLKKVELFFFCSLFFVGEMHRRVVAGISYLKKLHFRLNPTSFFSSGRTQTLEGDDPLYTDVPKPRRRKSERKPYPTAMKVLIRRAKEERAARKAEPCRILEEAPDNGLLVPQLIEVAHRVYRARESLLLGLSKLVHVAVPVKRCRYCTEVHIGHVGHEIRTCTGPKSGFRSATHVWRTGGIEDLVYFPACFHLHDRVGKPRIGHDEKSRVSRLPAIVELCIQAGLDLKDYPTRRRTKPVYWIEGRIADFEAEMEEEVEKKRDSQLENEWEEEEEEEEKIKEEWSVYTVQSWLEMITGAKRIMEKYSVKTCGYCAEVQVGPKGHKVRMCRASKHQSRNGLHAWQEATIEDLVGPNYVWHVQDPSGPAALANNLKRYYGKAPAVVELCVQAGAPVPDEYRSMMRLDVVPPDRDEVDLVA
ncbi:hypothetical protein HHK36_025272 [Tetracentron sinense]|uniref:APO domain-containing protein n=1 Tax=Tetracentron sinense TaxID=13715 RepID=A0A834YMQ9_TETSI|nr:hypothetical protein HHK36_025272 [Tetracentron sinense]